jgi:hypothetical protein
MKEFLRMLSLRTALADEGAEGGTEPNTTPSNDGGQEPNTTPEGGGGEKFFSQEDLDKIIQKRLARERKSWETQLEEEKKKASMSEAERLKAEKEEAEARLTALQTEHSKRLINAEAKLIATELGVKADKMKYLMKLVDLDEVTLDEEGNVDTEELTKSIQAVLDAIPELKGGVVISKAGAEFNGNVDSSNQATSSFADVINAIGRKRRR